MGEGRSHWSSMVLRKSQTCFSDRHTHPNSMYLNFCHVLNANSVKINGAICNVLIGIMDFTQKKPHLSMIRRLLLCGFFIISPKPVSK